MTWPPRGRREAIPGGVIVTGACGQPHLRGGAYTWWRCRLCAEFTYFVCPDCLTMCDHITNLEDN